MKRFFCLIPAIILTTIFNQGCTGDSEGPSPNPSAPYSQVDFEPSWSKQNVVAFTHSDPDYDDNGIYTVNYNGTNLKHVVTGYAKSPDWSPNSAWIVFTMNDQLYKIRDVNDSLVQLTFSLKNSYPEWSSDSSRIFFISCGGTNCGAYSMNPEGGQITLIYPNASYVSEYGQGSDLLLFSPVKNSSGNQTGDTLLIYDYVNSVRAVVAVLNSDENKMNSFPVRVDNDIIFTSISSSGYSYIYRISSSGINMVRLTVTQSYSCDYSGSNQKIIYTNRNQGNGRLWIMDKNGGNNVQFTH